MEAGVLDARAIFIAPVRWDFKTLLNPLGFPSWVWRKKDGDPCDIKLQLRGEINLNLANLLSLRLLLFLNWYEKGISALLHSRAVYGKEKKEKSTYLFGS